MPIRVFRRAVLLVAAVAVFLVFLPATARAQGLTILQKESLPRIQGNQPITKRPSGLKPEGISYQDCIDDQKVRFALQLGTPEPGASLQAWAGLAGASCSDQQARSGSNATCWPLLTGIPNEVSTIVDIPVRAIMAGAPPFRPSEPGSLEEVCGQIDLVTISVQFLYFSPGQLASPTRADEASLEVDTVGPAPPSGVRTLPGNQRIVVEWDNISGEGGVSLLTGVRAYCDVASAAPAPETPSAPDADDACEEVPIEGDAGEDAGTMLVCDDAGAAPPPPSSGPECASPNLSPGDGPIIPDEAFNQKYECGSLFGSAGASLVATGAGGKPLENDTMYAVAVAATDNFGNVGPLSGVVCQYPEQTNDFWENYKNAGGGAGGGLCAATSIGTPAGSLSALALVAIAAGSLLRRRVRR